MIMIRRNKKNTMHIETCLKFDTILLVFQNQRFRLKRGWVFSCRIRERGGCQKNCPWGRHNIETFSALLALCEGIPLAKASDAELWCFLWSAPEQMVEQTIETPVIWDTIAVIMMSHSAIRCHFYLAYNVGCGAMFHQRTLLHNV